MPSRNMSLEQGPLEPIGILALLESKFEIYSTSHYRELTTLSTLCKLQRDTKCSGLWLYYPLHVDSPWAGVCNLTR